MESEVQSAACLQQILYLFVRFGAAELLAHFEQYSLGHAEFQGAGHLRADQFGHECLGTVSGAAEFHDVLETVVSISHGR